VLLQKRADFLYILSEFRIDILGSRLLRSIGIERETSDEEHIETPPSPVDIVFEQRE
jgi:hypothetical protein